MGDYEPDHRAKEGVQTNILPCMPHHISILSLFYVYKLTIVKKQTTKTYHRPDPSFTYLLCFFLTLTSLAWGFAYADGFTQTLHITLVFIFGHFLLLSLVTATLFFFLVGRLLGPGGSSLLPGRRRGLYNLNEADGGKEELEFGYCWDVAIRAFVPVWVFLYVVQFLCMPLVGTEHWYVISPYPEI
jgi:hypothetical protein